MNEPRWPEHPSFDRTQARIEKRCPRTSVMTRESFREKRVAFASFFCDVLHYLMTRFRTRAITGDLVPSLLSWPSRDESSVGLWLVQKRRRGLS